MGAEEFPAFKMEDLEFEARKFDEQLFRDLERESVEVPRPSERVYGEGEIARLPIDRVIVKGIVPYPEQGITLEAIQNIVDLKLIEEQATDTDENGFTRRDLDDIGMVLRRIWDRNAEPDADDLAEIFRTIQVQEVQRGWITLEQLDAIALAVTEYYRSKGFILATAFIPEQKIAVVEEVDTVISIEVLEGRLGDVIVSNNVVFEDSIISSAFTDELGKAVTADQVESALFRVNDLPGVRVRGSFSPGEELGETRLNLGVLEEKSWTSSILADNHGSETTGENRLFLTTQFLNVGGKGHRLVMGLLQSEGPDDTTYGLLEYEAPVTKNGRGKVKAAISTNQFSVTRLANLPEIIGESENYGISGSYQFLRSRQLNLAGEVGYMQKDVLFQVLDIASLSTDQVLESVSIGASYTQLWDNQQLLLTGGVGVDQGHIISGELRDQATNFTKLLLNSNLLKRFSIGGNWLIKNESFFNFVFKLNGQYTEQFLSSVEQFSLGGPNAVRAFGVSDVSVDSGAYAGFELYFDFPFRPVKKLNLPLEPLRPYIFYDYGYGVAYSLSGIADRDAVIKGYGVGLRVSWPGVGVANLILAKPQSAHYQDDFLNAQGKSRIFLDVTYQIH
jgi:hemolysin activation/secretion protein